MHDAFGRELKVGDRVMVPMTIKALHLTADYCNCELVGVATMPPAHQATSKVTLSAVNTQQILRANDGDDLKYRLTREPLDGVKMIPFTRHFQYVEPPTT
jgi:hypothetical protein